MQKALFFYYSNLDLISYPCYILNIKAVNQT